MIVGFLTAECNFITFCVMTNILPLLASAMWIEGDAGSAASSSTSQRLLAGTSVTLSTTLARLSLFSFGLQEFARDKIPQKSIYQDGTAGKELLENCTALSTHLDDKGSCTPASS
jgi:hypothetical protein